MLVQGGAAVNVQNKVLSGIGKGADMNIWLEESLVLFVIRHTIAALLSYMLSLAPLTHWLLAHRTIPQNRTKLKDYWFEYWKSLIWTFLFFLSLFFDIVKNFGWLVPGYLLFHVISRISLGCIFDNVVSYWYIGQGGVSPLHEAAVENYTFVEHILP